MRCVECSCDERQLGYQDGQLGYHEQLPTEKAPWRKLLVFKLSHSTAEIGMAIAKRNERAQ